MQNIAYNVNILFE